MELTKKIRANGIIKKLTLVLMSFFCCLTFFGCKKEKFPVNKKYLLNIEKCQYFHNYKNKYYEIPVTTREYDLISFENNKMEFIRAYHQPGLESSEIQYLNVDGDSVYGFWQTKTGPLDKKYNGVGAVLLPAYNLSGKIKKVNKKWVIRGAVNYTTYHIDTVYSTFYEWYNDTIPYAKTFPVMAFGVFEIKQRE